jgi:predicted dehydrogenase
MYPAATARTHLPVAHAEGFSDTFRELYRAVYRDIIEGRPSPEPDYPTFRDGHIENVLCGAIARSHREGSWIEL